MITQEQMVPTDSKRGKLFIGIPRESTFQENRIALVPSSVAALTAHGNRIVIETDAGLRANFSDHQYSEAGASIATARRKFTMRIFLIKVAPPTLDEIDLMRARANFVFSLAFTNYYKEIILQK